MRNFVDLGLDKNKKLVQLLSSLTNEDTLVIDGHTFDFTGDNLFTESIPANYKVTEVNTPNLNDTIVVFEGAVFRIGYYESLDHANRFIMEGVGCILVNSNTYAEFSVEGFDFTLQDPNNRDTSSNRYSVNIGNTLDVTASNIANAITLYCTNVIAYSLGNCVIVRRKFENAPIYGNVANIKGIYIEGNITSDISIGIGEWTFTCSVAGNTGIDETAKRITFPKGTSNEVTLKNFEYVVNRYADKTKIGFARYNSEETKLYLYISGLQLSINETGAFKVDSSTFSANTVASNSIITVDNNGSLSVPTLYNIYGINTELVPQIAACLYDNNNSVRNIIDSIKLEDSYIRIIISNGADFSATSYSEFIYCSTEEASDSYAIINNCINKLSSDLTDEGIGNIIYNGDSIKIISNNIVFEPSENIKVYSIGDSEYPSSKEDPMSVADFSSYIDETSGDKAGEVTILNTNNNDSYSPIHINKDISLTIIGSGDSILLSSPLFIFRNNFITLNIENFQIEWNCSLNSSSSSVFDFQQCQGNIYILNNEIYFESAGHFFSLDHCVNLNISNKHSSYLIGTHASNISIFNVNNSSINVESKYNAIECVYPIVESYFYNNNQNSYINLGGSKDLLRRNVIEGFEFKYSANNSDNTYLVDDINTPYSKIFCGLYEYPVLGGVMLMPWSFNLTCDSKALNLGYDPQAPNDIFGRKRGLSNAYGKTIMALSINNDIQTDENSFISIDGRRFTFVKGYDNHLKEINGEIKSDIVNTERLVKAIVEEVSYTSDYKITYEYISSGSFSYYNLIVHGKIVDIQLDSSLNFLTRFITTKIEGNENLTNSINYLHCIDFGARQKYTEYDNTFYVDTEINSFADGNNVRRLGTKDDMFSCLDMINWCKSSYPRFGNTTFVLKSKSIGENVISVDLSKCFISSDTSSSMGEDSSSRDYSVLYGDVLLKSTMVGLRAVPILKHFGDSHTLFTVGCYGAPNVIFENILIASGYQIISVANDTYKELKIELRNCIFKNFSDTNSIIDFKNTSLSISESTLIDSGENTNIIEGSIDGITKIEATILGKGLLDVSDYEYNKRLENYNYHIDDSEEVTHSGTSVYGPDCLVDAFVDEQTFIVEDTGKDIIGHFEINTELSDNVAINFIPSLHNLILSNPTVMFDIGGRYRYNEVSKVSLDVGAIESTQGLVDPTAISYYVSLGSTSEMKNAGNVNYISWEDLKEILESKTSFENVYKIYLSGSSFSKKEIVLKEDVAFNEQAKIEIYGEKDCVFEGESFFRAECDYVRLYISGVTFRTYKSLVRLQKDSTLLMTNCFVIGHYVEDDSNAPYYLFDINSRSDIKMFSCSIQSSLNHIVFNLTDCTLSMFGCVAQGIDTSSLEDVQSLFGYDGTINTSHNGGLVYSYFTDTIDGEDFGSELLNTEVTTKEYVTSSDSELLQDPYQDRFAIYYEEITNDIELKNTFDEAVYYNWKTDIVGNTRYINNNPKVFATIAEQDTYLEANSEYSCYGCYDSKAKELVNYYDEKPNREITCITEIGRTMISKMLTNTARFRIEGFAICSDGYDYDNPVMASKIRQDVVRERIVYRIKDELVVSTYATITVGKVTVVRDILNGRNDFKGGSKKQITKNLVNAINKVVDSSGTNLNVSASMAAYVIDLEEGLFGVEKLLPGTELEEVVCSIQGGLEEVSRVTPVNETHFNDFQVLPKTGLNVFEHIDYVPLALSMYYRIDRQAWSGGFGSEVVFARVVNDDESYVYDKDEPKNGELFPLCVCHHGLITKGHDSFVIGRIVLQL